MPKKGPFHYDEGMLREKTFGDRRFTVLLATAYEQGIIGTEYNGLVVLDEDRRQVVLDQHLRSPMAPTQAQRRELDRVADMGWDEFRTFCMDNPRFREACRDSFDRAEPEQFPAPADREIFPAHSRPEGEGVGQFPLTGREAIIGYFLGHSFHREAGPYSPWRLAWNVKVGAFDESGMQDVGEGPGDPAHDERWERWLDANPDFFHEEAASARSYWTDGEYAEHSQHGRGGGWEFASAGRSAGWLVLTGSSMGDPSFRDMNDAEAWLRELRDDDLVRLYVMSVDMDSCARGADDEMSLRYAMKRREMERRWDRGEDLDDEDGLDEEREETVSPRP